MWVYGHRGAPATFPENTMVSFEEALRVGADAIETDIRVSCDGRVVIFHDPDATRLVGHSKSIESSSWLEISDWDLGYAYQDESGGRPFIGTGIRAPLLEEVLHAFPDTRLNIDVKDGTDRAIQATVEVVRAAAAEERVLLTGFHTRTRRRLLDFGYAGPLGFGIGQVLALRFVPSLLLKLGCREGDRVQIPTKQSGISFDTSRFIHKMTALGIKVDFWTINEVSNAERLVGLGADGIITDDPQRIGHALRAADS